MNIQTQTHSTADLYANEYKNISDSLARGEIGLLIGAGMSIESEVPDGITMAKFMLRRAVLGAYEEKNEDYPNIDRLAEKYPFESIAEYLKEELGYHDVYDWLSNVAGLSKKKPNAGHRWLHEIQQSISHRFPKTIFTTNFDTLIEDEFGEENALCITSENLEALREAHEKGKIAVVHLHGCIKHPKSIVTGEKSLLTLEGPLFDLLRGALATEVFLLIGYSLADTNLKRVFFDVQRVAETRQGLNKRTYAVFPAEGEPGDRIAEAGIVRQIWKQRGVTHIAASATEFFDNLFEAINSYITFTMKEEVAAALKTDKVTLEEMLKTSSEPFVTIKPFDLLVYLYYTLTPLENKDD